MVRNITNDYKAVNKIYQHITGDSKPLKRLTNI